MSSILRFCSRFVIVIATLAAPWAMQGQTAVTPESFEYPVTAPMAGDQVHPQLAIRPNGGLMVWQDNATDGDGMGISAQVLDANLYPSMSAFRINVEKAGDQENPQVAFLKDGGAVVVWQGGEVGSQHIFARFLTSSNTFSTSDIAVSSYTDGPQVDPQVSVLADGSVLVSYSSEGQDGSMSGIFAQRLTAAGAKAGAEFQINQFTNFNQRTPTAAVLGNGTYVLAWISEQQRSAYSVGTDGSNLKWTMEGQQVGGSIDVYARLFDSNNVALGNEFLVNTTNKVCANPALAATGNGGFVVAWSQNNGRSIVNGAVQTNGWDVVARVYDGQGKAVTQDLSVNTCKYGEQFAPRIQARGNDCLVVWTSLGQDGSWEGVYGRGLSATGVFTTGEFLVNTTTVSQQMHPAVATDGGSRFLVVWTSFVGGQTSFDLFGQRYYAGDGVQPLAKPSAPMVAALSQGRLSAAWPAVGGAVVSRYVVFMDDSSTGASTTNNYFQVSGLVASSSHSFRVQYVLADGQVSPLSDAGTGVTWGEDLNGDGLPDDWQTQYWGAKWSMWPAANADTDRDGMSNFEEFLAGTNPNDPSSVLKTQLAADPLGWRLSWNTQPGFVYQVQSSVDFVEWTNTGTPRYAAGTSDSTLVNKNNGAAYFRIVRVR
jgi:hypothetical protein